MQEIKFTKATAEQRDLLTIVRQDGSVSKVALEPGFIQHDLMHYAVETILKIRGGFLDLVMQGRAISDFDQPESEWDFQLPIEATHVEVYVGLFQLELWNGQPHDDFANEIERVCREQGVPLPRLIGTGELRRIRRCFAEVNHAWEQLLPGETLTLPFNLQGKTSKISMSN